MPDPLDRRRWLILAICCLSLFIAGIDNTIVNVALPAIGRDLHTPVVGLQWTVDAYTLVLASFVILAGATGDRLGRRRTFQTGLALFTAGSLLCSLAPSLGLLIVFRIVQAAGGSMLNPVAMSIIANTFTRPDERARAIGIWGATIGVSMALGPVLGGLLVDTVGWRSIFWVNIPVGLAAIMLTSRFIPESRAARPRRPDPVGQMIVVALLASLTYAIIEGPVAGWRSATILGLFAVAVSALGALGAYETRRAEPLLDPRFFRSIPFTGATVIAMCAFAALGGFLFLNTLYLQDVRGLPALRAGLYTMPMAAMSVIFAPLSGRITAARGPRLPLVAAGAAMTAGAAMLTVTDATTPTSWLVTAYLIFGIGFGLVNAPITNTAVSGMPRSQAGVAAAVAGTSRQAGQSTGVAVIGAALSSPLHGSLRMGFGQASEVSWWIIAACGAAVVVLGVLTTSHLARGTAVRTADRLIQDEDKVSADAR